MIPDDATEKYRVDLAIVRETARQVLSDFGIFGFEVVFSGNPYNAFPELKEQLTPILLELFQRDRSKFQSLLYRIDISENKFRTLMEKTSGDEFAGALSELILQREFQKVLTRRFYSKD